MKQIMLLVLFLVQPAWAVKAEKDKSDKLPPMKNLLREMLREGDKLEDGVLVVKKGAIVTKKEYGPPVEIHIIGKTDSINFRIGFVAKQFIFNWDRHKDVLVVEGGLVHGQNQNGKGEIPAGEYVHFVITLTSEEMVIKVDDDERFRAKADFSQVKSAVRIFPALGSTLSIKYVGVKDLGK